MEIATEDQSGLIGACDRDYGCIYMNTLSWRTPTTPMPMEINPRKVFERMFGQGGSAGGASGAHASEDRSILDAVTQQIKRPAARASARKDRVDRERLPRERARNRAAPAGGRDASSRQPSTCPPAPVGIPFEFEEHINADVRPAGARLPGGHHARVHVHGGARGEQQDLSAGRRPRRPPRRRRTTRTGPRRSRSWCKIQTYHIGLFARVPAEAQRDSGRRRHAARPLAHPVRQQHEQQQRRTTTSRCRISWSARGAASTRAAGTSSTRTTRR